jgi:hypothetical protein
MGKIRPSGSRRISQLAAWHFLGGAFRDLTTAADRFRRHTIIPGVTPTAANMIGRRVDPDEFLVRLRSGRASTGAQGRSRSGARPVTWSGGKRCSESSILACAAAARSMFSTSASKTR